MLFIIATASTMAAQIILSPLLDASQRATDPQTNPVALAVLLEIANALASAGIAIAFYPVLRRCAELAATGYLGLRVIEGAVGVVAATVLAMIISTSADEMAFTLAVHDTAFLMVLLVFSCGTLLLYPMLYAFRLVPPVLSLWGLIGGLILLVSCVLILFGQIEVGGTTDLILSLPIWINEMALALWLLARGVDLKHVGSGNDRAA
ncbi:DUF4386 domain-containing protein [Yoonia sp. SDW83-1]|uniref:DUF4386 domain-containing protein n=1 Tax=Yoonia sp. SDW83-1 TaxID=3366945 RepID=UPI00398C3B27